jgi:hypothetical protein
MGSRPLALRSGTAVESVKVLIKASAASRFTGSSRSEPMSLVNVELYRAVVTHLQQKRLAVILMLYVHSLHDFENLQRLFAKGN